MTAYSAVHVVPKSCGADVERPIKTISNCDPTNPYHCVAYVVARTYIWRAKAEVKTAPNMAKLFLKRRLEISVSASILD